MKENLYYYYWKNLLFQLLLLVLLSFPIAVSAQLKILESEVGLGWSNNSVNTVIFRNSALTSFKGLQFTAYYDAQSRVVLAKRKRNSKKWETLISPYKGNTKDAHNAISIAVDSQGYLHISWDHHDTPLRYAKGLKPLSLELGPEQAMTGEDETKVTYPEFHNLPDGNLLFCYRSGASGRGNMILKSYDVKTKQWRSLQNNLINGENQRSAYWQICVGKKGIYLSWVWRESWDVSTNHTICYAFSGDGGKSWEKSSGEKYVLPITKATAEVAWQVPQKSSLINQTAMTIDQQGNPFIASYWDNDGIPQYKVIYHKDEKWNLINTAFHKKPFFLGGGGTKRIPIARPEILVNKSMLYLLIRDEERSNKILLASSDLNHLQWLLQEISSFDVGQWEPNFDKELWAETKQLQLFSQQVNQVDGEGLSISEPTVIKVLEVLDLPKAK